MTIPRQLAPTVGLTHDGDEFLEESLRDREVRKFAEEEKSVLKGSTSTLIKIRNYGLMECLRSIGKINREDPEGFVWFKLDHRNPMGANHQTCIRPSCSKPLSWVASAIGLCYESPLP